MEAGACTYSRVPFLQSNRGLSFYVPQLVCRDPRLLSVLLDFMRLSSDPTEDIATALAFLSSACGHGRLVTTTAIKTGFLRCTSVITRSEKKKKKKPLPRQARKG